MFAGQDIDSDLGGAYALLAAGRVHDCARIAQRLAGDHPQEPRVWHLLSCVYARIRLPTMALKCASRAVALAPNDPTYLVNQGQCLVGSGNRRDALAIAERLAARHPERADLKDALGTLFTFCEEPQRALPLFLRAVALSPNNGSYLYNLATAQRMVGEFAAAEKTLGQVIDANPLDVEAYATRSSLRTQSIEANHVAQLQELLQRVAPGSPDAVAVGFALSKELEDLSRYPESFAYLKQANELHRRLTPYDVRGDIAVMDELARVHDAAAVRGDRGFSNDECIFVLGLPRSGTTLVERILSSHSQVASAGELQAFPHALSQTLPTPAHGKHNPIDFVRAALEVDPSPLGRAYVEATRPQTGKTQHFVDKLPSNYLNAGLIHRSLPQARIVALARLPMDSCYALYKTRFSSAYDFSYDLSDLARYYAAWHRLMRHWKNVLGESLLIVQYEDLVTRQEAVTRQILRHCGLDWQDACLEFHRQQGAVTTASAAQVRQALYRSSLGKWRHLEVELQGLSSLLSSLEPDSGWRFDRTAV